MKKQPPPLLAVGQRSLMYLCRAGGPCSGAQRQDKGQWAQTEAEEVLSEHEEEQLPSEGDKALV